MMKRWSMILVSALLLCSLSACDGTQEPATGMNSAPVTEQEQPTEPEPEVPETTDPTETQEPQPSTELSRMMDALLEGTDEEIAIINAPVDRERFSWFFGVEYVEGSKAYSSEAAIGALPHSIALLKVAEDTDAEALAKQIEQNVDPRKWVCVEAEKKIVKQNGRYILVILSFEDTAQIISDHFDAYFEA